MIEKSLILTLLSVLLIPVYIFAGEDPGNPIIHKTGNADELLDQEFLLTSAKDNKSIKSERYLCVAEKVTGFKYDKGLKSWVSAIFKIDEHKYIILRPDPSDKKLEVRLLEVNDPICWDNDGFNEEGNASFNCITDRIFKVNKKTGRFLTIYPQGYIHGDEDSDTPFIVIGKCSSF